MISLDEKNNQFAILFLWLFDMYNIFALVEMLSLEPRIDHKICIMSNNRQSRYKSRITGRLTSKIILIRPRDTILTTV
jgi:hypothetical protein